MEIESNFVEKIYISQVSVVTLVYSFSLTTFLSLLFVSSHVLSSICFALAKKEKHYFKLYNRQVKKKSRLIKK